MGRWPFFCIFPQCAQASLPGPLYISEKKPSLCIFSTSSHSGSLEMATQFICVALICTSRPSDAWASCVSAHAANNVNPLHALCKGWLLIHDAPSQPPVGFWGFRGFQFAGKKAFFSYSAQIWAASALASMPPAYLDVAVFRHQFRGLLKIHQRGQPKAKPLRAEERFIFFRRGNPADSRSAVCGAAVQKKWYRKAEYLPALRAL